MKKSILAALFVWSLAALLPASAAADQTIWYSSLRFLPDDPSRVTCAADPSIQVAMTEVNTSTPGDFQWIYLPLSVPAGVEITAVRVCYRLSDPTSFISQIRLGETRFPDQITTAVHDDPTDRVSPTPECVTSTLAAPHVPGGSMTLELRLNFASASHSMVIGAVGLDVAPVSP